MGLAQGPNIEITLPAMGISTSVLLIRGTDSHSAEPDTTKNVLVTRLGRLQAHLPIFHNISEFSTECSQRSDGDVPGAVHVGRMHRLGGVQGMPSPPHILKQAPFGAGPVSPQ